MFWHFRSYVGSYAHSFMGVPFVDLLGAQRVSDKTPNTFSATICALLNNKWIVVQHFLIYPYLRMVLVSAKLTMTSGEPFPRAVKWSWLTMFKSLFEAPWLKTLNVVVEWLTFQFRIQEVQGSNLDSETSYPDWGFSWSFSIPPDEFRDSAFN
jgi:hypothetical protein